MRFMLIVKANKDSEAEVMPGEQLLAEMAKFNEEMVKAGVMLAGEGLRASKRGARVKFTREGKTLVTDGPFTETKDLIAGFWIIKVNSLQEAVAWARRSPNPHPHQEGEIEIRQIFELEDFGESPAIDHHRDVGKQIEQNKQRSNR
jgi:hypothetical protein